MTTIEYVAKIADKLTREYKTRDPFEICAALGIRVRYMDLGTGIKAYYYYKSRIRNIVLNNRVSELIQRILAAHELGHDRLHRDMAMLRGFQEIALFDSVNKAEYEANLFAAEFLIDDDELLDLLNDDEKSFFGIADELSVPADLLDFKFRVMKYKGYRFNAPILARGDFLKGDIGGCFEEYDVD